METDPSRPRPGAAFCRLVDIMATLLGPNGCPWDREQTVQSLQPYLIEEAFEVLAAIDSGDLPAHCEELGDLLLQVVFQAGIRQAEGHFDIDAVATSIADKLIRRHPHVFADGDARTAEDVATTWEAIKAQEKSAKGDDAGVLSGVPVGMPAMSRAQKISARAARVGFDWPDVAGCRAKVIEELEEIEQARKQTQRRVDEEVGDLLFAAVSLSRKLGVDAEGSLRRATRKFELRFAKVEAALAAAGKTPAQSHLEEMDRLWNAHKHPPDGSGDTSA